MPRKPTPKSKPTVPEIPPHLKPGAQIEISSDDPGYRGSWFTGTVIRRVSAKQPNNYIIQYHTIFKDEAGKKPLRETQEAVNLRPLAPKEAARNFRVSERVDAFDNDGWWEGVITEELGNGRYNVYFRSSKEMREFEEKDLRLHREWIDGVWNPSLEDKEEDENTTKGINSGNGIIVEFKPDADQTRSEKELVSNNWSIVEKLEPEKSTTVVEFSKGARVEVSSDEEGFKGAWFAATIVNQLGKDRYLIQYETLRTDDDKDFLQEEADTLHIRPYPPETSINRYKKLQEVDAFHNDGWWVGIISKVHRKSRYNVFFRTSSEELEFEHSQLRPHLDWIDGKWVVASQAMKL